VFDDFTNGVFGAGSHVVRAIPVVELREKCHECVGGVRDVDEIPSRREVAEFDVARTVAEIVQDGGDEMFVRFVCPEHVEQARARCRDARLRAELLGKVLADEFRAAVDVDRSRVVRLVVGPLAGFVDRCGGREHDLPEVFDVADGFQEVPRAHRIHLEGFLGMVVTVWDVMQRGEVDDGIRCRITDGFGEIIRADVPFVELRVLGDVLATAGEEVVNHDERRATVAQSLREMRSDEPRPARDENRRLVQFH
jgi:hypothetical protein